MPCGTRRGPDFENAVARLWNDGLHQSIIVSELATLGWEVSEKIVRNYASKLGLPRRGPSSAQRAGMTTALSDQERAIFFRGLERLW